LKKYSWAYSEASRTEMDCTRAYVHALQFAAKFFRQITIASHQMSDSVQDHQSVGSNFAN